jgi:hypothetical protein
MICWDRDVSIGIWKMMWEPGTAGGVANFEVLVHRTGGEGPS